MGVWVLGGGQITLSHQQSHPFWIPPLIWLTEACTGSRSRVPCAGHDADFGARVPQNVHRGLSASGPGQHWDQTQENRLSTPNPGSQERSRRLSPRDPLPGGSGGG